MNNVDKPKSKLLNGGEITREEAVLLIDAPLGELCAAADEIRARFCGNIFDMCTIIKGNFYPTAKAGAARKTKNTAEVL